MTRISLLVVATIAVLALMVAAIGAPGSESRSTLASDRDPALPEGAVRLSDSPCMRLILDATDEYVRNDLRDAGLTNDLVPRLLATDLRPSGFRCKAGGATGRVYAIWENFKNDSGTIVVTWLLYSDPEWPARWREELGRRYGADALDFIEFEAAAVAVHGGASDTVKAALTVEEIAAGVPLWEVIEADIARQWRKGAANIPQKN